MPEAAAPSEGFLSRIFGKKKKARTEDIQLPNTTGQVDPRIERFKRRGSMMQPNTKTGATADKVQEGYEAFHDTVRKIRERRAAREKK